MGTENLNQALAQLESSLLKIDSARVQVEKVTESGSELTNATHKLAEEVRVIAGIIKTETVAVIDNFSERLTDFDKKIETTVGKGQENITEQVEKLKKTTKEIEALTVKAINEATSLSVDTITKQEKNTTVILKTLGTEFTDKLSGFEKQISNTTEKNLESIKLEIEKFKKASIDIETLTVKAINEATLLSVDTITKQEKNTTVVLKTLGTEFTDKLSGFEKQISSTTEKSLGSITIEFEKFKKAAVEIETVSTNSISEVKTLSVETLQKQDVSISKTIASLLDYITEVHKLIDEISAMELPKRLIKLETSVSEIHTDLQLNAKSIKRINSIIIISALITLGLLIGLILK